MTKQLVGLFRPDEADGKVERMVGIVRMVLSIRPNMTREEVKADVMNADFNEEEAEAVVTRIFG